MTRYFGNAVFEGEEVSDRDYEKLMEIREDAQAELDVIIGGRVIESVWQVKGEPGSCELCDEKIGEIGTIEMLEEKDCVPPFHKDCRCVLVEIGYCIL